MTPEWRDLCLYNFCSFDDVSDFGLIVFIFVIIENIVGLFDYFGSLRANFDTILHGAQRGGASLNIQAVPRR